VIAIAGRSGTAGGTTRTSAGTLERARSRPERESAVTVATLPKLAVTSAMVQR
jgi:hypothetical protein